MTKIRLRRIDLLDTIILLLLLSEVMIIRWLNLVGLFNKVMLVLLVYKLLRDAKRTVKNPSFWLFITIVGYFFLNYFILGGSSIILISNIFECATPILVMIYIYGLMEIKGDYLKSFFCMIFWPINMYMLLNIPIIYLQMKGVYWLAGFSDFTNSYYADLISGLFGYNGTPVLALFSAFVVEYNYCYAKLFVRGKRRLILMIYDIALLMYFVIISLYNDNKAFYLIVVIYAVMYYLSANARLEFFKGVLLRIWGTIKRFVPFLITLLGVLYVSYKYTRIQRVVDMMIVEWKKALIYGSRSQGSSERFSMIFYILQSSKRIWGYGLGNYTWTSMNAFGFVHFGQSDVGAFMCLGGVAFFALIVAVVYTSAYKAFENVFLSISFLVLFLILGVYTQIFTVTSLMISTMLFVIVCWTSKMRICE